MEFGGCVIELKWNDPVSKTGNFENNPEQVQFVITARVGWVL